MMSVVLLMSWLRVPVVTFVTVPRCNYVATPGPWAVRARG